MRDKERFLETHVGIYGHHWKIKSGLKGLNFVIILCSVLSYIIAVYILVTHGAATITTSHSIILWVINTWISTKQLDLLP